jgi:FixJ family two-component response regulator
MKNQAFDFLLKPFSRNDLNAVLKRAFVLALQIEATTKARIDLQEKIKGLSPREREVFYLLAKGFGNQEILTELDISLHTVKQYKSEVMRKLKLQTLAELIALAGDV